jgi:U3 small nucleolar ribonucleoprotein component
MSRAIKKRNADKAKKKPRKVKKSDVEEEDEGEEVESDWVDEDSEDEKKADGSKKISDDVLQSTYPIKDVKMVLVVREDLKMQKGKIGA